MNTYRTGLRLLFVLFVSALCLAASAEQRTERFDTDPKWDGYDNRSPLPLETATQDFGYSPDTDFIGNGTGEVVGIIQGAGDPAWYGKPIPTLTLDDELKASGKIRLSDPYNDSHFQVGFFNSKTTEGWRTPNTINLRIAGRGDEEGKPVFIAFADYLTKTWRAGGLAVGGIDPKTGRERALHFDCGETVHTWSIHYVPNDDGSGSITGTIDDESVTIQMGSEHRVEGASFDRFGLINAMKYNQGATHV